MSKSTSDESAASLFRYLIAGLRVASDVELRSAIPCASKEPPEVTIRQRVLPPAPEAQDDPLGEDVFRLRIGNTGRFLIRAGREIAYETFAGYDEGELALHLIGTCFTVLLQQRGYLVMHGSAISVQDRAVLFCGASGAGKSTLAAMLCQRGYPLLNDDVCSLRQQHDGRFAVYPDGRMLKLWRGSLHELKQQPMGAPVSALTDKFYMEPPASDAAPRTLAAIYFLHTAAAGSAPFIEAVRPGQAMLALRENAYRPGLVDAMDQGASFFQATAALCRTVKLFQLHRAKDFTQSGTLMDLLEAAWQTLADS